MSKGSKERNSVNLRAKEDDLMEKHANKAKVSLFKNDKITLIRSTGKKMSGKVTELSDQTFWVKYKNPDRWPPDSKIGDTVNMVLHFEHYEVPFSAKIVQRFNPGDIAVDVCYEAGEDLSLVQRHDQYRKAARFPLYICKIPNMNEHSDFVMNPKTKLSDADAFDLNRHIPCKSMDISGSGLRLQTETDLTKGSYLECTFKLDGHLMAAVGIIMTKQQRRSSVHEYGVRFQKIHPENVRKIIRFVYQDDTTGASPTGRGIFNRKKQG